MRAKYIRRRYHSKLMRRGAQLRGPEMALGSGGRCGLASHAGSGFLLPLRPGALLRLRLLRLLARGLRWGGLAVPRESPHETWAGTAWHPRVHLHAHLKRTSTTEESCDAGAKGKARLVRAAASPPWRTNARRLGSTVAPLRSSSDTRSSGR